MTTQHQYIVPIYCPNEETWSKIHMRVQPLNSLYDEHGNLKDCMFGKITHDHLGSFYVFLALEQRVAEAVRDELLTDKNLIVLPIKEYDHTINLETRATQQTPIQGGKGRYATQSTS